MSTRQRRRLLVVHHTPSPAMHAMFEASTSGALKHFFDQIYYPCLDTTVGRPFGVYLHGDNDTTGAM